MSDRPWVLLGAAAGGSAGYFLGGKKIAWAAIGVLAGIVAVPAIAQAAIGQLSPPNVSMKSVQLVPGQTIIERAQIGDVITVLAPRGWGVPSAGSNIPGFLQIEATSTDAESTTFKIITAGAGQVSMTNGGEVAILAFDVLP